MTPFVRILLVSAMIAAAVACRPEAGEGRRASTAVGAGRDAAKNAPKKPSDDATRADDEREEQDEGSGDDARRGATTRCVDGERRFAVREGGVLQWIAVKGAGVPVTGEHAVSGELLVTADTAASARLALAFAVEGDLSRLPLRDDRLRAHVLGAAVTFTLDSVEGEGAEASLPGVGETVSLSLVGTLVVGEREVSVTVPVLVTGTESGLEVREGLAGVTLDLRRDLGLGAAVDALMALVDGVMEDALTVRFALVLDDRCR